MKLLPCALTCALLAADRHWNFDSKTGNSKGLYPKLMAKENQSSRNAAGKEMRYDKKR
jgi:hypothetical protein